MLFAPSVSALVASRFSVPSGASTTPFCAMTSALKVRLPPAENTAPAVPVPGSMRSCPPATGVLALPSALATPTPTVIVEPVVGYTWAAVSVRSPPVSRPPTSVAPATLVTSPTLRPVRRRSFAAVRLVLFTPLTVTLPRTSSVSAVALKLPVPAAVARTCEATEALAVVLRSPGTPGLAGARSPNRFSSATSVPLTLTFAPLTTCSILVSSVTPRWKCSVASSANTIWSSAVRASLSKPPPVSLSIDTATSLKLLSAASCVAPPCVTTMRRPVNGSAMSPRSVSVSAKLPPEADPLALPRIAPFIATASLATMLTVPALLACCTCR